MTSAEPRMRDRAASEESLLASLLDELTEALRQGRQPDVEQVANRHPALAADLRSLWATVWVAEEMARKRIARSRSQSRGSAPSSGDDRLAAADRAATATRGTDVRIRARPVRSEAAFGEYELFEELGRGGMGVVSRAREIARGRIVALKRLLRGPASTPQDIERFRVEAHGGGAAGAPSHRAGLSGRRVRRAAVLHHAIHRGDHPGAEAGRRPFAGAWTRPGCWCRSAGRSTTPTTTASCTATSSRRTS